MSASATRDQFKALFQYPFLKNTDELSSRRLEISIAANRVLSAVNLDPNVI